MQEMIDGLHRSWSKRVKLNTYGFKGFNIINTVKIINTNIFSTNNEVRVRMGYEVANSGNKNGTFKSNIDLEMSFLQTNFSGVLVV